MSGPHAIEPAAEPGEQPVVAGPWDRPATESETRQRPLQRSDFHFDLPPELIAQRPLPERGASRLLALDGQTGALRDLHFGDLPSLLRAGDLLVFNNTRVIPARLYGQKETGGKVEVLIERLTGVREAIAQVRASKPPRPGTRIRLADGQTLIVSARQDSFYQLQAEQEDITTLLARHGHVPLPPYIERADDTSDLERYQTVYARRAGAVAAPTAGLHFDDGMLKQLEAMGVDFAELTLHVGAGTFQPVRVDNLDEHQMHAEWLEVSSEVVDAITRAKARGGRVVAVGTTSVRSLETAAADGQLRPFCGDSRLFIRPGYRFRVIDAMVTNFHLPESTLLMLVSAFAGYRNILAAYQHAVAERYRFFSYGDAMFLTPLRHSSSSS